MTFSKWFNEADIPMQDKDGVWYDAETGIPYSVASKSTKRVAKVKTPAEKNYGHLKADALRATVDRLIASARISIERESHLDVSALVAVVSEYEAYNGKMTKAQMLDLIDANSKASRAVNAQR